MNKMGRRIGDRYEGRRIRGMNPMDRVAWFIMPRRNGANNLFADSAETGAMEEYIRQKRADGLEGFGMMHVLVAAYVRMVSQKPALNRFISGQKLYARNEIWVNLTVKKEMRADAPETIIKAVLPPEATAEQVFDIMNGEISKSRKEENDFEDTARLLNYIPRLLLKLVVWLLNGLDYFGLLPPKLLRLSPFHGSLFITSMGSLGIPPVFHHLYDFGNIPVFCSFGAKDKRLEIQKDGSVKEVHYLPYTFTTDERICDGFYYASAFKILKSLLKNPWELDFPPAEVRKDID